MLVHTYAPMALIDHFNYDHKLRRNFPLALRGSQAEMRHHQCTAVFDHTCCCSYGHYCPHSHNSPCVMQQVQVLPTCPAHVPLSCSIDMALPFQIAEPDQHEMNNIIVHSWWRPTGPKLVARNILRLQLRSSTLLSLWSRSICPLSTAQQRASTISTFCFLLFAGVLYHCIYCISYFTWLLDEQLLYIIICMLHVALFMCSN